MTQKQFFSHVRAIVNREKRLRRATNIKWQRFESITEKHG